MPDNSQLIFINHYSQLQLPVFAKFYLSAFIVCIIHSLKLCCALSFQVCYRPYSLYRERHEQYSRRSPVAVAVCIVAFSGTIASHVEMHWSDFYQISSFILRIRVSVCIDLNSKVQSQVWFFVVVILVLLLSSSISSSTTRVIHPCEFAIVRVDVFVSPATKFTFLQSSEVIGRITTLD